MRLHEFTNPKDYTLLDTKSADHSKPIKRIERDDMTDDTEVRPTKRIVRRS
jgi:hypothetical protein